MKDRHIDANSLVRDNRGIVADRVDAVLRAFVPERSCRARNVSAGGADAVNLQPGLQSTAHLSFRLLSQDVISGAVGTNFGERHVIRFNRSQTKQFQMLPLKPCGRL